MKNTYSEFLEKSYKFPQKPFAFKDENLTFHDVDIKFLIEKYGTPFKMTFLPKIGEQIKKARQLFDRVIEKNNYTGKYHYSYCTKCNHLNFIVNEVLEHNVNIETSSSFDIDIILSLYNEKKIDKQRVIIHNGYKTDEYLKKIIQLQELGFENSIIIIDSENEFLRIQEIIKIKCKIGLRMAINEDSKSSYNTSRLGIRISKVLSFYKNHIKKNKNIEFVMFHFFVDSGITDTLYYWEEFNKAINLYIDLKTDCKTLNSFNIGGGFPIPNNLDFNYNYEHIINKIIVNIKDACDTLNIEHPEIHTEFGKYTVGESSAIIFKVLEQKQQNDTEKWYIIDNSLLNTIPDAWGMHEKFILLPINKWANEYDRVNIGGISCDFSDYYNSEDLNQDIYLPNFTDKEKEQLYIGFFHTGAYQDAVSGYGGAKHCLVPSPKHVVIGKDKNGELTDYLFSNEQSLSEVFSVLGYKNYDMENMDKK